MQTENAPTPQDNIGVGETGGSAGTAAPALDTGGTNAFGGSGGSPKLSQSDAGLPPSSIDANVPSTKDASPTTTDAAVAAPIVPSACIGRFEYQAPYDLPAEATAPATAPDPTHYVPNTVHGYGATKPSLLWRSTNVFPGATGWLWVYVPDSLVKASAAPLLVMLDSAQLLNPGGSVRMWTVMSKLFETAELTRSVAVFVNSANAGLDIWQAPDKVQKLLSDEILPFVQSSFGVKLSTDRHFRAIGGVYKGAPVALTIALESNEYEKVIAIKASYEPAVVAVLKAKIEVTPARKLWVAMHAAAFPGDSGAKGKPGSPPFDYASADIIRQSLAAKNYPVLFTVGRDTGKDNVVSYGPVAPRVLRCLAW